jgi:hypothetical protein
MNIMEKSLFLLHIIHSPSIIKEHKPTTGGEMKVVKVVETKSYPFRIIMDKDSSFIVYDKNDMVLMGRVYVDDFENSEDVVIFQESDRYSKDDWTDEVVKSIFTYYMYDMSVLNLKKYFNLVVS